MANFYGTASLDIFIGPNQVNNYYFDTFELSPTDIIVGGTAADEIHFSGVQVLGWNGTNYFANVSSIEFLYFDDFTDIVEIPDSLVTSTPGTALYRLIIRAGGGDDEIDASDVTSALPILIEGEDGEDMITGGGSGSKYTGGEGDDIFYLRSGIEEVLGGDDDDAFSGNAADFDGDTIDGGADRDTLLLLSAGTFSLSMAGIETMILVSGGTDVTIESPKYDGGSAMTAHVEGGAFEDIIDVESLDSPFIGETWENYLIEGFGDNDIIGGGNGDDTLDGGSGVDSLAGGDGDDTLIGGTETDILSGGDGDDLYVDVGSGDLVLEFLSDGTDTVQTALAVFTMQTGIEILDYTGTAAMTATGNSIGNTVDGSANGDTMFGRDGDDVLNGLDGNDTLNGEDDEDTLFGGNQNDTLNGGGENDTLYGGLHTDILDGGKGDDFLQGDSGTDTLDGGSGIDTASYLSPTAGVDVDLERAINQAIAPNGIDQLSGIENVIGTTVADIIQGDVNANVLTGDDGDDTLAGRGGDDTLDGGDNDDTLLPGSGNDTVIGGGGTDTADYAFSVSALAATNSFVLGVTVVAGADVGSDDLTGVENVIGGSGNDAYSNWAEAHGGGGDDTFIGDNAINAYYGDSGSDTVRYFNAQGTSDLFVDLEDASLNRNAAEGDTLESIENVTYQGTNRCDLLGDENDNRLEVSGSVSTASGRGGDDTLVAAGFADILDGGEGFDTADYSAAATGIVMTQVGTVLQGDGGAVGDGMVNIEAVKGSAFADVMTVVDTGFTLFGLGGADTLTGGTGADTLDGGADADTLAAGAGDDLYYVNNAGDVIVEATGKGTLDQVATNVSYTLAAGVEVERFNTTSSGATYAIDLTGNAFVQTVTGNAGVNVIDGKGGADTMIGAAGNDLYFIDNAGDVVTEGAGQGTLDQVAVNVGYTLGAGVQVERLNTTSVNGTTAINLTGNEFGQTIFGNAGANTINGRGGNDTLTAGAGNDILVFNTALNGATNVDSIADFDISADSIHIDNAVFTALAATGVLAASAFRDIAAAPKDASDRIIYNSGTGNLYYDADGSGIAFGNVKFAALVGTPALTAADFLVI